MLLLSEIQGDHKPGNGDGISLEDLYGLLKAIPRKIRESNYPLVATYDGKIAEVTGLSFGKSDQAPAHEFHTFITLSKEEV